MKTALVCGAGGFIGHHLVKRLKSEGYFVVGVDLKLPEFEDTEADEFLLYDLRDPLKVSLVMFAPRQSYPKDDNAFDEVYQLAADMGGAGYIFSGEHDADLMHNSALVNLNVAHYAKEFGVNKVFYSSSACMYPQELQERVSWIDQDKNTYSLKESSAYPANPDSEYGWEKLFSERLFLAYQRNYNLNVRIARFHNIYGPMGTYKGGREKAPAAICRKVIENDSSVVIWGDGEQTRSFLYIDDCIDAVRLLMQSDFTQPINIGSEEMVSINELAKMAMLFEGKDLLIEHIDGPQGVRGRNSNNDLIRKVLNWEPKYSLMEGLGKTYTWIKSQMK
jgi:GDP-D-mannose 3',5'-epimerase